MILHEKKTKNSQSIFRYTLKMLVDFSTYAISSFPHITSSELKVSNWVFPPILLVIFVSIIQKFSHLIMIFTDQKHMILSYAQFKLVIKVLKDQRRILTCFIPHNKCFSINKIAKKWERLKKFHMFILNMQYTLF